MQITFIAFRQLHEIYGRKYTRWKMLTLVRLKRPRTREQFNSMSCSNVRINGFNGFALEEPFG